ncbi:CAP domain containing protein, partial [Asbolus verrucosus]
NKLTTGDINTIVNKHNQLRSLIANGKVPGQPKGVNINYLKWDPNLAKEAQKIANTCNFQHVKLDGMLAKIWPNLPQLQIEAVQTG